MSQRVLALIHARLRDRLSTGALRFYEGWCGIIRARCSRPYECVTCPRRAGCSWGSGDRDYSFAEDFWASSGGAARAASRSRNCAFTVSVMFDARSEVSRTVRVRGSRARAWRLSGGALLLARSVDPDGHSSGSVGATIRTGRSSDGRLSVDFADSSAWRSGSSRGLGAALDVAGSGSVSG